MYGIIRLTYVDAERQLADKTSGGYDQGNGKIMSPVHDDCCFCRRSGRFRILFPQRLVSSSTRGYSATPKKHTRSNNVSNNMRYTTFYSIHMCNITLYGPHGR